MADPKKGVPSKVTNRPKKPLLKKLSIKKWTVSPESVLRKLMG